MALAATGLILSTTQCGFTYLERLGLQMVSLNELLPGDIISLGAYDHSLVYLDHEICLSCNGRSSQLQIHSINDVLKTYNVDSLSNSEIRCYRKQNHNIFSKKLISTISEQTKLHNQHTKRGSAAIWPGYPGTAEIFQQHFLIMKDIYDECHKPMKEKHKEIHHALSMERSHWNIYDWRVDSEYNSDRAVYTVSKATYSDLITHQDGLILLNQPFNEQNKKIKDLKQLLESATCQPSSDKTISKLELHKNTPTSSFIMQFLSHPATPIIGAILLVAGKIYAEVDAPGICIVTAGTISLAGYAATKLVFFTKKENSTAQDNAINHDNQTTTHSRNPR